MVKRVLLIDDDPIQNLINSKMIKKVNPNIELSVAENGQEAADSCFTNDQNLPETIFLDINMPIMDGWEFLDFLSGSNLEARPNIYMLSSSVSPEDVKKSESNPLVKGFITKPLSLKKLDFLK